MTSYAKIRRRRWRRCRRRRRKECVEPGLRSVIYSSARQRLREDDSLRLGHNCCAVCAKTKNLIKCRACESIVYCSRKCASRDQNIHAMSCVVLRTIDDEEDGCDHCDFVLKKLDYKAPWVSSLIASDPCAAELTMRDLSLLSYPLSLGFMLTLVNAKHVLVVGAGRAECSVPCWSAVAGRLQSLTFLGPELTKHSTRRRGKIQFVRGKFVDPPSHDEDTVVVGFNLGLTCPDYDWTSAPFSRCRSLVLFSNTRTELQRDFKQLKRLHSTIMQNPFHCPRWRQSNTLANDIFRKHTVFATSSV